MYTHGQIFLNHGAPGGTALRRTAWINLHTDTTGSFRLVLCVGDPLIPSGVSNAFRQAVILDHPRNTQVLAYDHAKLSNQTAAEFVGEVLAAIGDAFVHPTHTARVILAFRRTARMVRRAALGACKCLFIRAKAARVGNTFARGKRRELFQTNINANDRTVVLDWCRIAKIARHDQIPVIGAAGKRQRFDRAVDWTMQQNPHGADVLEVHPIPVEVGAVVHHKINGIETISPLESWVACRCSTLDAPEERLKGLIQASQRLLATGEVGVRKIQIGNAIRLQLCRLIAVAHAALSLFPCIFAFGKRTIVQMPMGIKHLNHCPRLLTRWVQPVAERCSHTLAPCLLLFDVVTNRSGCNRPCAATKITSAPQRWQLGTQMRKLLAQHTGRIALELVGKKLRRVGWIRGKKEMHMIWHHFQAFDLNSQSRRFFVQQFFQACFNRACQNRLSIFWTPNKMNMQVVHAACVFAIPLRTHVLPCSTVLDACQLSNTERRKGKSPAT